MFNLPEVLLVSSDTDGERAMAGAVAHFGVSALCASSVREAVAALSRQPLRLVLCDARIAGGNFRDVLAAAKRASPGLPVVVTSRLDSWEEYLEAMRCGAFDYMVYPFRRAELQWILEKALRMHTGPAQVSEPGGVLKTA